MDTKAGFGDFGSALIITVNDEGKIVGCVVARPAHEKKGFSSVGNIKMSDFKVADAKIQRKIATAASRNVRADLEVKIKFRGRAP